MYPVLTREQKRRIKSGELTDKQIERMKNSCETWKLEVSSGKDRDGNRIRHTETFHGNKRAAKKRLDEMEAYWGSRKVKDRTLKAYIDEYMRRKKGTVADSTYIALTRKFNAVKYALGEDTKLSKLTPVYIDDKMAELLTKGGKKGHPCKRSYVANVKATLGMLLKDAVRHGALVSDPMPLTDDKLRGKAEKRKIPPVEDLLSLMRKLDVRDHYHMAIMLALTLGLRRQECAAIRFSDIDEAAGKIYIRRSVRQGENGEEIVEVTKTEAGMRDIPLPRYLPALLEKRRRTLEDDIEVALRSGEIGKKPEELYICATKKGEPVKVGTLTHYWGAHRESFGVHCSFHDLRHAFVSCVANESGRAVFPNTVAALAGHADASTTMSVYVHHSWDSLVEAVEGVSDLFEQGLIEAPAEE
jgi:integrase